MINRKHTDGLLKNKELEKNTIKMSPLQGTISHLLALCYYVIILSLESTP